MTNEEAIKILRDTPIDIRSTREDDIHTLYATAQNMAIDALNTDIVRCEECKKQFTNNCYMIYGKNMMRNLFDNDFCSYGERR